MKYTEEQRRRISKHAEKKVTLFDVVFTRGSAVSTDQKCQVCRHPACPCCGVSCCHLLLSGARCCEGLCSYKSAPKFFAQDGTECDERDRA